MTDIVERLKSYRTVTANGHEVHHAICSEAAEEIESLRSRAEKAEAELLIHRLGHEEHIYEAFNALFERGRAAGGFEDETQNLIRELTNAMRDAANWRAETKIAIGLEQQMRKTAEAEVQYWINQDEQSQAREADALDTCEKLAKALEKIPVKLRRMALDKFEEGKQAASINIRNAAQLAEDIAAEALSYRKEASE